MRSNRCKQCIYTIWVETAIIDKILLQWFDVFSKIWIFTFIAVHTSLLQFFLHISESTDFSGKDRYTGLPFFINFTCIKCWWNALPRAFLWKYFKRDHFNIIVLVKRQNYFFMSVCQGKYTWKTKWYFET